MEKQLKEILSDVAGIGQLLDQIKEDTPAPAIEIDIILQKIRELYEDVRRLEAGPAEAPVAEKTPVAEDAPLQAEEIPEPAAEIPEPVEETPAPPAAEPKTRAEPKPQANPEILADRYKDEKRYINESFSGNQNKQDLTSKLQSKPIENIHSALGINDRFKLINTLFNGDKASFENAIAFLNEAGNFNDAFTYINSSFDWDMEDEAVQMLLDLVRRKFIVNKED